MITKCKRLKNIGKFYDFLAQANALDWHKNTFVFAPNACGKSTFVETFVRVLEFKYFFGEIAWQVDLKRRQRK